MVGGMLHVHHCSGEWNRDEKLLQTPSKVPFIIDRIRQNLHRLRRMVRECDVWSLSHPHEMRGKRGTKTVKAATVKFPLLLPHMDQMCNGCGACGDSVTCDVRGTPQQYEAGQGQETVSGSTVKCPLLLRNFD
jgi:hypothetical protein